MFPQLLALYTSYLGDAADPLQPIIHAEMKKNFDYIEYHLTGHSHFAGDELSGADIQMVFPPSKPPKNMAAYMAMKPA